MSKAQRIRLGLVLAGAFFIPGGDSMHKLMIGGFAGLALLGTGLLSWDANATTLTGAAAPPSSAYDASPVQTVACWCGPLGGTTAALGGGPSYRCSCHRART